MFIIILEGGSGMGLVRSNKTWLMGIVLISLCLFLLLPLYQYQNLQPGQCAIPNYHIIDGINNRTAILKESYSNYWVFIIKSFRFPSIDAKYFTLTAKAITPVKLWDTRNVTAALDVIFLFIMFYRLSNTSFQKPDSHKRQPELL
jgi:hypothetical protein